jgi:hypothetical protein
LKRHKCRAPAAANRIVTVLGMDDLHHAMIVTVIAVWVMKMTFYQIVGVVVMRHSFVTTVGAMDVVFGMASEALAGSATIWMFGIDFDFMFDDMITFLMLQVATLQVIGVAMMFDRRVPATGPVLMLTGLLHNFILLH